MRRPYFTNVDRWVYKDKFICHGSLQAKYPADEGPSYSRLASTSGGTSGVSTNGPPVRV